MQSLPKQQKATEKVAPEVMTEDRKSEVVALLTDDVLTKLTGAFFDVCAIEHWTKRDLAKISGMNETAIGHILAGRRKNLTIETIALLARAMKVRPELMLHDTRPTGNEMHQSDQHDPHRLIGDHGNLRKAWTMSVGGGAAQRVILKPDLLKGPATAERLAYAQPEFDKEAQL